MPSLTGSFTIPLELAAPPERVWPLFAELPLRKKWVRMPGPSSTATHEFDFRPGGRERMTNTFTSGDQVETLENRSTFYDVIPNERIVSSCEAIVGGLLRWVIGGTRLRLNGLVAAVAGLAAATPATS